MANTIKQALEQEMERRGWTAEQVSGWKCGTHYSDVEITPGGPWMDDHQAYKALTFLVSDVLPCGTKVTDGEFVGTIDGDWIRNQDGKAIMALTVALKKQASEIDHVTVVS